MLQHIVIRSNDYFAGTSEKPKVGIFTQTHSSIPPIPWNQVSIDDVVWMKWSGGPIVAKAIVEGFRQIENCTPEKLRQATYGCRLHDLTKYWERLPEKFYGMAIYLKDEQWLDEIFESNARSYGASWIPLSTPELEERWLTSRQEEDDLYQNEIRKKRRSRTIGDRLRFEVFRRDSFTCQYCGRRAPDVVLHIDHVIPWSKGGSNNIENLVTACQECNLGKSDKLID